MIAYLVLAAGALLLAYAVWQLVDALASRNWPEVRGEIFSAKLEEVDAQEGLENIGQRMYTAKIRYRYSVQGRQLESDQRSVGGDVRTAWSSIAKKTLRKYPYGAVVPVFYNPDAPEQAVLERGVRAPVVVLLVISLMIVGGSIFLLRG